LYSFTQDKNVLFKDDHTVWRKTLYIPYTKLERLHDDTHTSQSVGLLWTSGQSDTETSTWQNTTTTRDIHAVGGIRPTIPANERPQTLALGRAATGIGRYRQCSGVFGRSKRRFSQIL